jgi:hypothetical protein
MQTVEFEYGERGLNQTCQRTLIAVVEAGEITTIQGIMTTEVTIDVVLNVHLGRRTVPTFFDSFYTKKMWILPPLSRTLFEWHASPPNAESITQV